MTLSDLDLETRLRDQRTRADETPPAPVDLAQRVRERARAQRRRRIALTAAGIAATLVFVGLPTLVSGLVDEGSRGEAASPSRPRAFAPSHLDLPTRGSLAEDEEWLAEVRTLSWLPDDFSSYPPEAAETVPDPAVDDRKVVFAGDVPGGRMALVMARLANGQLVYAWFAGPTKARPADLRLALHPWEAPRTEPLALVARPDPASDRVALVLVAQPGDTAEVLTGREVDATGATRELWKPMSVEDGVGVMALGTSVVFPPGLELRYRRPGWQAPGFAPLQFQDDLVAAAQETLQVADPRGLLGVVDAEQLQWTVTELVARYGLPADELRPTLLAGGSVGPGSRTSALLVGITFPSGATTVQMSTYWGVGGQEMTVTSTSLDPAPAGTPLLDRLIAVATSNAVTVSGPSSGVTAELYRNDGSLAVTVPLVDGAGIGPLPPPSPSPAPRLATVRFLDARGAVMAESTVEQQQ